MQNISANIRKTLLRGLWMFDPQSISRLLKLTDVSFVESSKCSYSQMHK